MAGLKDLAQLKQTLDVERRAAEKAAEQAQQLAQEQAARRQQMQQAAGLQRAQPTSASNEGEPDFSQLMADVRPIRAAGAPPATPSRRQPDSATLARRLAAQGGEGVEVAGISDMQALMNPVTSEAVLSWKDHTLPHRIFDQLKAGTLRWYQAVDLHGCTVEQGRQAVLEIIHRAQAEQQATLKIVHGKGDGAMLKSCVNGWLRQHPQVLAFHSAPDNQGGTGAVLVLIRKGGGPDEAGRSGLTGRG